MKEKAVKEFQKEWSCASKIFAPAVSGSQKARQGHTAIKSSSEKRERVGWPWGCSSVVECVLSMQEALC